SARQTEPGCGQWHAPHDAGTLGVDAHQAVLTVAVVGDDDGPVGQRHKVQGERADGDGTPGRTDTPAGREQRGPVGQRARDETGGEDRCARDGGQREQGALAPALTYSRMWGCRYACRL